MVAGNYMKHHSLKNLQGLTLVELLVVMAIVMIFAVIGVPSFNAFMSKERLAVATNELYNAYRFARNEAIKTSASMTLDAAAGGWGNGWQVKNSSNTVLLKSKVPHTSITVSASAVTVQGMGAVDSAVNYSIAGSEGTNCIRILTSGQSELLSGACP